MSTVAAPYGLKPISLIGGQSFTGGTIREYLMTTNTATAIFNGALNDDITPFHSDRFKKNKSSHQIKEPH